ncbi:MAG: hypothetical protein KatS3mg099_358 [Candidatus Parcubacteria bacterium]|nr:MAG: hypothetical protein KatS3mg099_358 [Candidatus Parcubacteria bacterium]
MKRGSPSTSGLPRAWESQTDREGKRGAGTFLLAVATEESVLRLNRRNAEIAKARWVPKKMFFQLSRVSFGVSLALRLWSQQSERASK